MSISPLKKNVQGLEVAEKRVFSLFRGGFLIYPVDNFGNVSGGKKNLVLQCEDVRLKAGKPCSLTQMGESIRTKRDLSCKYRPY